MPPSTPSATVDRLHTSSTLAPPTAFSHGAGTFRKSLRNIPSVLFAKEKNKPEPPVSVPREAFPGPPVTSKSPLKSKKGTKTRKALGELFGWGNHAKAHAAIVTAPAPAPKAPLPPPKQAVAPPKPTSAPLKPAPAPAVLRKPPSSRLLSNKPSNSALSTLTGRTTLKPPQDVRVGRPSMGEDPFGRRDSGAEVVDVFTRHGVPASVKSASTHRRESYSSSKALSMKTVLSDEGSAQRTPKRQSVATSKVPSRSPHRRNGHTSSPPPARIDIVDLPPRSASIGHILDVRPIAVGQTTMPQTSSPRNLLSFAKLSPSPKMKREKTKSKVWGFFAGGKKAAMNTKIESKSEYTKSNEEANDNEQYVKINLAPPPHSGPGFGTISDFVPVPVIKPNTGQTHVHQARPPALHISQPSTDAPYPTQRSVAGTIGSCSTVRSPIEAWTRRPIEVTSRGSPPRAPSRLSERGAQKTATSHAADAPSENGSQQVVTALLAPRGVPKRKSLTGLFGVSIKKSLEKIRTPKDKAKAKIIDWNSPKLRSLAEEMEDAQYAQPGQAVTKAGFLRPQADENIARASPGLRRVASATDKLFNLLSHFDLTPSSTPRTIASPAVHKMGSHQSLGGVDGSPTPMRRFASAMLASKCDNNPVKTSTNVSPLKVALHRYAATASQSAAQTPVQGVDLSAEKTSMVRKGMRNIFAPPSPTKQPAGIDVELLIAPLVTNQSSPPNKDLASSSPSEVEQHRVRVESLASSDGLPSDLRDLIGHDELMDFEPASIEVTTSLGLPPPPSWDRPMPRRPGAINIVPAISLPPIPSPEAPRRGHKTSPTHLRPEWAVSNRDSAFSDASAIGDFDFTSEYQGLDRGSNRASFVAAVQALGGDGRSLMSLRNVAADDLPSLVSPIPKITRTAADDDDELASDEEWDEDEDEEVETQIQICRAQISPRREPFKGQWAFQQRVSTMSKSSDEPPLPAAPTPALPPPPPPPPPVKEAEPARRRGHRRDESGLSIATMSSIGEVIETNIAGEYTNYFEVNFSQHLAAHTRQSSAELPRGGARAPTRRAHHRRNSSIISVESVGGVELAVPNGPPISLHNSRRSSYISRHRRSGSSESGWGRADWAAHRRNGSADSTSSAVSVSRLGRPGLGERMFQQDCGVQLTSITGSPSEMPVVRKPERPRLSKLSEGSETTVRSHRRVLSADSAHQSGNNTTDSLLDGPNDLSFDSLLDGSQEIPFDSLLDPTPAKARPTSGESSNSFFGVSNTEQEAQFFLRGFRPVSGISQLSSSETHVDDTFINVGKHAEKETAKQEECLQANGEDTSMLDKSSSSIGRQLLNESVSRPAKPKGRHRRPPPHASAEHSSETPGLTYSASEASSRMSLETRFTDFGSFSRPARPWTAGHKKQKSSGLGNVSSTIREESSMATVRALTPAKCKPNARREPIIATWNEAGAPPTPSNDAVASWLRFQREAESVCQIAKTHYRAEDSIDDLNGWKMPITQSEIAAFLAKSSAAYKPLPQLPMGRIAHRRKSSLADSRMMMSPYGLPLPRPAQIITERKKGSLETKFERSNSAGSSTFSFAYAPSTSSAQTNMTQATYITVPTPTTASIFAQFTRQHSSSPPQSLSKATAPGSPFRLSLPPSFEPSWAADKAPRGKAGSTPPREQRPRVNSGARRQALGWGRRRNSDAPDKVIPIGVGADKGAPKTSIGATFASAGYAVGRANRNKENVPPLPPVPTATSRLAVRAKTSKRKALAPVQPRGLRI